MLVAHLTAVSDTPLCMYQHPISSLHLCHCQPHLVQMQQGSFGWSSLGGSGWSCGKSRPQCHLLCVNQLTSKQTTLKFHNDCLHLSKCKVELKGDAHIKLTQSDTLVLPWPFSAKYKPLASEGIKICYDHSLLDQTHGIELETSVQIHR